MKVGKQTNSQSIVTKVSLTIRLGIVVAVAVGCLMASPSTRDHQHTGGIELALGPSKRFEFLGPVNRDVGLSSTQIKVIHHNRRYR